MLSVVFISILFISEVEPFIFKDISIYTWSWIDFLQWLWYIANGESNNNILIEEEREEMIVTRKKFFGSSPFNSWIFT